MQLDFNTILTAFLYLYYPHTLISAHLIQSLSLKVDSSIIKPRQPCCVISQPLPCLLLTVTLSSAK